MREFASAIIGSFDLKELNIENLRLPGSRVVPEKISMDLNGRYHWSESDDCQSLKKMNELNLAKLDYLAYVCDSK